jgi:hypothetical protein
MSGSLHAPEAQLRRTFAIRRPNRVHPDPLVRAFYLANAGGGELVNLFSLGPSSTTRGHNRPITCRSERGNHPARKLRRMDHR